MSVLVRTSKQAIAPSQLTHILLWTSAAFYGWRGFCRSKGIGWRLDSFIVSGIIKPFHVKDIRRRIDPSFTSHLLQLSERIASKALECEIRHECYGASDHVPIVSHRPHLQSLRQAPGTHGPIPSFLGSRSLAVLRRTRTFIEEQ